MLIGTRKIPSGIAGVRRRRRARRSAWRGAARFRNRCLGLAATVAGLWAAAAPCGAQGLVEPSWIPGINAGFEVFDSRMDYSVENFVNGPFLTNSGDSAIREFLFTIGSGRYPSASG